MIRQNILYRRPPFSTQGGVIVLAIMLILLAGSSYMLVRKLNSNTLEINAKKETLAALETARQVLISYAVRFPETDAESGTDEIDGPGYLPCPDIDNDGDAGTSCSDSGNTTIGRFPFRTLEVAELRDGNGQRLWYAIAENYRNNPKLIPLNSETPGSLEVLKNSGFSCPSSGCTEDVVAVVIAPGAPISGQSARGSVTESITDYLEGENADLDQVYSYMQACAAGVECFNDVVKIITRGDLMAAVESRVLGDVSRALAAYRNNHDAYPWLSPYTDPDTSAYHGILDTFSGHIPFHWSEDTPGTTNRNPFDTSIGWIWHTDVGTATGSYSGTVTADCLRNVDCNDGLFPPISAVTASAIDCVWSSRDVADCADSGWTSMTSVPCNYGCLVNGMCQRRYYVQFPAYTGTDITTNAPGTSSLRTRDVVLNGSLAEQSSAVQIVDTYTGVMPPFCITSNTATIGSGFINFTSSTTGQMGTLGIKYDLDIDNNELPVWFVRNEWNEQVQIAYADSEDYPGAENGSECTPGTDCLVLNWNGPAGVQTVSDEIRALGILSGDELSTQDRASSSTIDEYYELDNNDQDSVFIYGDATSSLNDRIRVLLLN